MDAIQRLKIVFEKVCLDFEAELVEVNGEAEHVQLLINYPPKHSVSSLVNSLKGVSSRLLRRERPDIEKRYWKNVLWSPSYFSASCGGAPLKFLSNMSSNKRLHFNGSYIPALKGEALRPDGKSPSILRSLAFVQLPVRRLDKFSNSPAVYG